MSEPKGQLVYFGTFASRGSWNNAYDKPNHGWIEVNDNPYDFNPPRGAKLYWMVPTETAEPEQRYLDAIKPDWESGGRVHNWKNYISEELRSIWGTFSQMQRIIIAENALALADNEDWE